MVQPQKKFTFRLMVIAFVVMFTLLIGAAILITNEPAQLDDDSLVFAQITPDDDQIMHEK